MAKKSNNMRTTEVRNIEKPTMQIKVILGCVCVGWLLYCACFYGKISNGFFVIYNWLLERWGKYTGTICNFYKTNAREGCIWCVVACVWIGCLLVYCLVKRSRKSWRYLWTKTLVVTWVGALAALILWGLGVGRGDGLISNSFRILWEKVEDIRYGTNEEAGLYRGDLYEASAQGASRNTEKTMLEIVMSHPESMYFKGFVGEIYEDGHWTSIENKKKYEDWELFYWLHKSGFYGQTQLGAFAMEQIQTGILSHPQETYQDRQETSLVSIRNVSADRRYMYAPYELTTSEFLRAEHIGDSNMTASGFIGKENYRFTVYNGIRTEYPALLEQENSSNTELHYRQWVYEHYLAVPQDFSRLFQSIFEQESAREGEISVTQAKQMILQYLTDYFQYEENLQLELDAEPLLHFLQKSGKGYDVHYASAATLMFRYLGIPARYVEGYLVTEPMAEAAGQSTVIELDAGDGHAWTEIYIDGAGWVPFEATPVYRDLVEEAEVIQVQVLDEEAKQELEENVLSPQQADSAISNEQEPIVAGSMKQKEEKELKDKDSKWGIFLCMVAIVLIVLIIGIIYIIAKIRKKKKLLWESFQVNPRSIACQNIFAYVMELLQKNGLEWSGDDLENNMKEITEIFSREYADVFVHIWKVHEQIRFGKGEPTEEVYEQMRGFLEYTSREIRDTNFHNK